MSAPIEELIKAVTEEQTLEGFLNNLEGLGLKPRAWRSGGMARSILRAVAKTFAGYTELMAAFIRGGFLETATGVWLTRLAKYVYGVDRKPSTFATGKVTLTNLGGVHGPFAPETVRVRWPGAKKTYVITEAFTLNSGDVVTLGIRADEAGAASSAAAGSITELETPLIGVSVTNAEPVTGSDEESDPELRQRCLDKLAALSLRGPRGAYRFAVKSAKRPDGSIVDINRVSIVSANGVVNLCCASPAGTPIATDLDYVRDSVEAWARPDSVTANVSGATTVSVPKAFTVWATRTDGLSATDLKGLIEKALAPVSREFPIGGLAKPPSTQGYLYSDYLVGLVKSAHPSIFDVDGMGADVALTSTQVAIVVPTIDVRITEPS